MTQGLQDQMRQLMSHSAAAAAETERSWGNFRDPVLSATGTLLDITGPHDRSDERFKRTEADLVFGGDFEVLKSLKPVEVNGGYTIAVRLPDKPNINSEIDQMNQSAGVDSLFELIGKKIRLDAATHEFTGRQNTGRKDAQGKDIWEDSTFTTRYYAVTVAGGGSNSNGAAAVADEAETAAVAYLDGKKESEIDPKSMMLALQQQGIDDGALNGKIATGVFVSEMVAAGKVKLDEEGVLALA